METQKGKMELATGDGKHFSNALINLEIVSPYSIARAWLSEQNGLKKFWS